MNEPHETQSGAVGEVGVNNGEGYRVCAVPAIAGEERGSRLLQADDKGSSSSDNITNVRTPRLTGTGEIGATITIYENGNPTPIGTGVVQPNGSWTITVNPFTNGAHNLTIYATDAAGNQSTAASLTVTIWLFADINQDNHVNISDVSALEAALADLDAYKTSHGLTDEAVRLICSINGDGSNNLGIQALILYLANGYGY
jgi:hypothetical protein